MAVLYRKYRPRTFSEVVGQEPIVKTLLNALGADKLAHAYLFTGSRGVGKTTVARVLARAVNCTGSKNGESCLTCNICQAFDSGTFVDMVEIDAASNNGVDNIRELIDHVRFQPVMGKYKVFVIDETHMLSKGAFNALLKTLEEPPEHTLFILATTELSKLPATIVSRTQRFDFKRFSANSMLEQLQKVATAEKIKIEPEVLQLIIRLSGGAMRDALSLLDKVSSLGKLSLSEAQSLLGASDISLSHTLLELILTGNTPGILDFVDAKFRDGIDPLVFNKDFLEYLRTVLVVQVSPQTDLFLLAESDRTKIAELATQILSPDLLFVIRLFLRSYKELQTSADDLPLLLAGLEAALKYEKINGEKRIENREENEGLMKGPGIASVDNATSVNRHSESVAPSEESTFIKYEVAPTITFEELQLSWPAVCEAIKAINSPLATLVRNSPLMEIADRTVYLGVKFLFHKEHIEGGKNQTLLAEAVTQVTGQSLRVRAKLLPKSETAVSSSSDVVTDALKIFGGELVE